MIQNEFIEELKKLNIIPTEDQLIKLEKFYNLLIERNKVMNLTAITKKEDVYLKHFYDSLTISKIIDLKEENSLCDLGSGAGFPGIVLKIFYPNLKITLIDSLNKRVKFLNDVIKELELTNIIAIHDRIENFSKIHKEEYDIVTARAVASTNILLELGINLVKVNKFFVLMKGNISNENNYDNSLIKLKCEEKQMIKFKLPKENSDRTLIKIIKKMKTPTLFPRKYDEIKRNPL